MRMQNILPVIALTAAMTIMGAQAQAADLLATLQGLVTGNLGLFIGLLLAVFGIWTWVVKQETMAGIMMIIGGVLITIAPGVMNTFSSFLNPVVDAVGGNLTNATGSGTQGSITVNGTTR